MIDDARSRIGWNLVLLARLYRREMDRSLQTFGLSEAATTPLRYLARQTEPLRQGVLAEVLSLEGPTVVRVLDQLERQGLIQRIEDPADRRGRLIEITKAGAELNGKMSNELEQMRLTLFDGVSDAQLEACEAVMNILDHNLRASKAAQ